MIRRQNPQGFELPGTLGLLADLFPSLVHHTMNSFAASPIFHDAVRNVDESFSGLECVPEPVTEARTTSINTGEMVLGNFGQAAADAMLLGRVIYEEWAVFWPSQGSEDQPFADYMNNTPRSSTRRPWKGLSCGTTRR
jgi:hypothetical protein